MDYNNAPSADMSTLKLSKSMLLSIAMVTTVSVGGMSATSDSQWKFYTAMVGKAVGSCGETEGQSVTADCSVQPGKSPVVKIL